MSDSTYQGDRVLDIMSQYAKRRNRTIEKLIRKYILDNLQKPASVLEFGAGKGEFILRFTSEKNVELIAVEIEKSYSENLSKSVKVYSTISEIPGNLDCIYLIDVLEHIENDNEILKLFYEKLKSGGRLFIYVPARMELYSEFDRKLGHFRRYTQSELKNKVAGAGFIIKRIRYHELLGYFASMTNKLFNNSGDLNPYSVKLYDSVLVPVTNFFERIIHPPFGKSLYIFAIKE